MKFWNRKDLWFTLTLGTLIFLFSWVSAKTAYSEPPLRSQTEVQQYLLNAGYGIEVDGIVGKDTRLAWDTYIMETRYAQDNSGSTE